MIGVFQESGYLSRDSVVDPAKIGLAEQNRPDIWLQVTFALHIQGTTYRRDSRVDGMTPHVRPGSDPDSSALSARPPRREPVRGGG